MDLPVAGSECPNGNLRTTSQSEGRRTWVRRGITLLYARRPRQYLDVRPDGVAAVAEKQTSSRCRHNRLSTAWRCRGNLTHHHGDLGAAARADIRRLVARIERRRGRYSRCDSLGGFATRGFPSRCVIPRANTRRAPRYGRFAASRWRGEADDSIRLTGGARPTGATTRSGTDLLDRRAIELDRDRPRFDCQSVLNSRMQNLAQRVD